MLLIAEESTNGQKKLNRVFHTNVLSYSCDAKSKSLMDANDGNNEVELFLMGMTQLPFYCPDICELNFNITKKTIAQ